MRMKKIIFALLSIILIAAVIFVFIRSPTIIQIATTNSTTNSITNSITNSTTSATTSSTTSATTSSTTSATTSSTVPPAAPTGLTATATSSSQIDLAWIASSGIVIGYKIERSVSGGTFSTIVANTGTTVTTYSDKRLTASTTYTYRVSAINFAGTGQASNQASATTIAVTGNFPSINHVFIVWMSNRAYSEVIGNLAGAPYQNALANQYSVASNYQPDCAGTACGIMATYGAAPTNVDSRCTPLTCSVNGTNIFDLLNSASLRWHGYIEDMSTPCNPIGGNLYDPKYNPLIYYTDIPGSTCAENDVDFSLFQSDLSSGSLANYNYVWIAPNRCDNTHGCDVSVGDTWLKNNIDPLIKSPLFASSVIFIVYDSKPGGGLSCGSCGPNSPVIVVSPFVQKGFVDTAQYGHYNLLSTVEWIYDLGNLGRSDATAIPMMGMFAP